jgi:hypothetical protein
MDVRFALNMAIIAFYHMNYNGGTRFMLPTDSATSSGQMKILL